MELQLFQLRPARDPLYGLSPQTQSPLAVSLYGDSWAIINASPDIRQQIQRTPALHPRALRHSPISSVVITNTDIDHIGGLLTLREKQPFDLFATSAISTVLDDNPIFRVLDGTVVKRQSIRLDKTFSPLEGLKVRMFSLPGKVALFFEEGEPDNALEGEQTVGLEFLSGNRRSYYVPACAAMLDWLMDRIAGADLVLFDGTVFTDNEMKAAGAGIKTGRRMGHVPISGDGGSLTELAGLGIGRMVYVHISNTNPIWQPGPERDAVEAAGFAVAHDGMEIRID